MSISGRTESIPDLHLMPRDDEGPVFDEPWQAQAFATVVELIESGSLSREEWAETLGAVLKEAELRGEFDTGERYYEHWLTAIEHLAVAKDLAGWQELESEQRVIEENDHHRREHQRRGDRERS